MTDVRAYLGKIHKVPEVALDVRVFAGEFWIDSGVPLELMKC